MDLIRRDNSLKLFILSCSVFAVGGISTSAIGVVWIYVQADFNVTLSALGALVTAATLGRILTSTSSGPLINRFGIASIMMAGVSVTAASMLGFALAPSWAAVMLVAVGSGVGSGIMATGLSTFAAVNFSARQMNWLHGSFGIGSTIGPVLITTIVIDLGLDWRWAYVVFTLIRIMLLLMFWLTRDEWRIGEANGQTAERERPNLRSTLRLPMMWLMIGAFMMATGTELVAGQFANSFLIEARAVDPKVAGAWVSVYWASLTLSRFVAGFFLGRISNGLFLRLNSLALMLGAALLWLDLGPLSNLCGLALIGFCIAPFAPLMASDTPGRVGRAHTANAIGLQFTGASIGMAFLPWLAGLLAEELGLDVIPQFVFLVALLTFCLHEVMLRTEIRRPLARLS